MPDDDSLSDAAAFGRLYEQQGASIRQFLCPAVRDRSAADDLIQETFLHLWRRPSAFDPGRGSIRAYLFGIARKKAVDCRPSKRRSDDGRARQAPLCSARSWALEFCMYPCGWALTCPTLAIRQLSSSRCCESLWRSR